MMGIRSGFCLTLRRSLQFIQLGLENRIAVLFVAQCVSANVCGSQ